MMVTFSAATKPADILARGEDSETMCCLDQLDYSNICISIYVSLEFFLVKIAYFRPHR